MKHRDILISSVAATIAAAIMMVARMAMFAGMFGGGRDDREGGSNPIALLAMMILAPIAAMLIQAAISRSREFAADAGGARSPATPTAWPTRSERSTRCRKRVPLDANPATAHMFIIKPFSGAGLMSLFSTHPPDRGAHPGPARSRHVGKKPRVITLCDSAPRGALARDGCRHPCIAVDSAFLR